MTEMVATCAASSFASAVPVKTPGAPTVYELTGAPLTAVTLPSPDCPAQRPGSAAQPVLLLETLPAVRRILTVLDMWDSSPDSPVYIPPFSHQALR